MSPRGPIAAVTKASSLALSISSRSPLASRYILGRQLIHHCHCHASTSRTWRYLDAAPAAFVHQRRRQYSTTPGKEEEKKEKTSDPLHILFCGSDDFSCDVLSALHDEHVRNPGLVRSIDVVVRPGKRTGRGYKVVQNPPIRSLAENLGLEIHERDTFTGWDMPPKINLVIAVSFGLFVPPRLLSAARYGGLNLHPSLLPDLRGPAPLHHTLLAARPLAGVTLQTLDPAAFDRGVVLAQTPADPRHPDALRVPGDCRTVDGLRRIVTPVAARMLVKGLREGLHVPPLEDRGWFARGDAGADALGGGEESVELTHAPKITKRDRRVTLEILRACDAETAAAGDEQGPGTLARRLAVMGPLWFMSRDRRGGARRVIVEGLEEIPGASRANRPGILLSVASSSATTSSHPSPPRSPSAPSAVSSDAPPPPTRYLIPFEGEEEEAGGEASGMNLVFWSAPPTSSSTSSSPAGQRGRGQGGRERDEELCLGNYRVLSLKVEGKGAMPARLALQNFFVDP
ncbi:formyl transferase [Xylaria palmicola]|nr:formyl transferase [Xylaria palmicola]